MANAPQMKIPIGANTQDFDKGAKKVKQEMRDLDKVSSDVFSSIGNAVGVDTQKLQLFSSALAGLGNKLQQTGVEGTKAFGDILKAIAPIGGAIAGIGLAAATVAFKSLKDEAESFKNTIEGANIEMATAAYVNTYKQVLHDYRKGVGEGAAELEASGKKAAGTFWTNFKTFFRAAQQSSLDLPGANTPVLDETWKQIGDATAKATEAEQITKRIYEITQQQIKNEVEVVKLDSQIAEYRRIAKDESSTLAQKTEAIQLAEDAIRQKYALQKPLLEELANLYTKRNSLAENSLEEQRQEVDAKKAAEAMIGAEAMELKSLYRDQKSVTAEAVKEARKRKEAADAAKRLHDNIASLKSNLPGRIDNAPTGQAVTTLPVQLAVTPESKQEIEDIFSVTIPGLNKKVMIGFEYDRSKLIDISKDVEAILTNLAETTGEVMGQLVGDLITGGDAWGNFRNSALSALGDMAISVGKMAVATGVATLGIKAALESLNGYVAIAAGTALIILGQAVKSGLSNVAAGNYSSGTPSVAAASTSATSSDFATKEVTVNVTGTLKADGNQLITVIQNTQNRNSYTG